MADRIGYTRAVHDIAAQGTALDYCHQHNLVDPTTAGQDRNFGIRVTLPANDTLRKVLGDDWAREHWYVTEAERDDAFEHMAERHGYYRKTDTPTQVLEKISR
ncbi:MAG TPA: hypothetical protein VLA11_07175 [Woeseiaceae bacterium]|nr:hypothetical protein [Woeseiaceae bacterium]